MHIMVCVVVAGIKQRKEKRIVVKGQESVGKRKKIAKLADFIECVIVKIDNNTPMKKTYSKLQRTIELANLALEVAKENLWINSTMPNSWEVVVLDQDGYVTNHKLVKDLNNKEILHWINKWTTNYHIAKMWRSKRIHLHNICYS